MGDRVWYRRTPSGAFDPGSNSSSPATLLAKLSVVFARELLRGE